MPRLKAEGIVRERNAWFFKPEFLESIATIALIPELVFSTKKLESYERPDGGQEPQELLRVRIDFKVKDLCKTFTQLSLSVMYLNQSGSRSNEHEVDDVPGLTTRDF
jgi:hypothetical protein